MLFNSFEFIFLFLPVTLIIFFFLNKQRLVIASKAWLVFASLFFYSWWNVIYLPLILSSILFNFVVGTSISKVSAKDFPEKKLLSKKTILIFGIASNVLLLAYFKYMDFFITNIDTLFSIQYDLQHIILPLGISFFTFTQIAYLVDSYRGEVKEMDYLNYTLFVTFFPHLLAGPILHHKEMMPQFDAIKNKIVNYKNISIGLFLFSIGLFKKIMIADTFAVWANAGYNNPDGLNFISAWITSLSYSFQLYFDFSGYTDMALGISLLFNIKLPINFNSPYQATNIQDFWRRWHMTLSRFLRDYIYIPLGGNKTGEFNTYRNLMVTFIIGGLWHGAGWTFIFWGFLHGFALVVNRMWQKLGIKINKIIAWFITFNFINITWVFFRANSWQDAINILTHMFYYDMKGSVDFLQLAYIAVFMIIIFQKNSNTIVKSILNKDLVRFITLYLIIISIMQMINGVLLQNKASEFLYFNF